MSRYLDIFVGAVCILGATQTGYKALYSVEPLAVIDVWFVVVMTALYGIGRLLGYTYVNSGSHTGICAAGKK